MAKKATPTTFVALVMDVSGSMNHIKAEAAECLNGVLASLRKQPKTKVGIFVFGDTARVHTVVAAADKVRDVVPFACNEYTALYDGVGVAVEALKEAAARYKKSAEFLVITFTDGEENRSKLYTQASIKALMTELNGTDKWTFAFNVPPGFSYAIKRLGIDMGNIREWEGTKRGMIETRVCTVSATNNYFDQKGATGASATRDFYSAVQTDMSKVATAQVKRKLDDVSDRFKAFEVKQEVVVRDFVEAKLKRPYVIGQAYYQLMKPEKVQPSKQVLIQEKGKQAVWGGPEARELIGLPANQHAKVTPGNHSNYDIYVQSASVNRKLPRGTKILVDTKLSQGVKPTWDHTAVDVKNGTSR
jgi:hypothetical protein